MRFKFIKYSKIWFSISAVLVSIGIIAMMVNVARYGQPLRLGIDFTGGSLMELKFESQVDRLDLRDAVERGYPQSVEQITLTGDDTYIIQSKDMTEEQLQAVTTSVTEGIGAFELLRFTTIGPKIGDTLKQKATLSLIIALAAIVLYIAYAFRKVPERVSPWRFGMCAIVALVHDVIITLGVFAILGYEVNAFFITALLTVIGFSVHDTIVVFDRIRENLKSQTRNETFGDIADVSLNQTLARSINTSLSTLITLLALYIWGSESIKTFIFALIVGITVGTYSSIFIATPLLSVWQERKRVR